MVSINDKIKEYSATPRGKIVVVAAPVAVLVLIVAVVVLTVLKSGGSAGGAGAVAPVESTGTVSPGTDAAAETSATPVEEAAEPPINQDYEVYETRDPFRPADAAATPSSTGAAATSGSANNASAASGGGQSKVLALKSVTSQNGVLYANVDYGTNTYVVRSGERVGDSPYQVTSISSESAAFLYGDDTVTLRVGEEVQK